VGTFRCFHINLILKEVQLLVTWSDNGNLLIVAGGKTGQNGTEFDSSPDHKVATEFLEQLPPSSVAQCGCYFFSTDFFSFRRSHLNDRGAVIYDILSVDLGTKMNGTR
jgi:hypothetical protein